MNCSNGRPARCASAGNLSKSGPIFFVAPAGLNVWHVEQPLALKSDLPEVAPPAGAASFFCWPFAQERNFCLLVTSAVERISACPRPQSSVQTTGNVPTRSGVTGSVLTEPGTASSFWPHSGTQNECVTSTEVIRSATGTSTGTLSVAEVMSWKAGYLKVQKNCCALTSTTSGLSGFAEGEAEARGMSSFFARTTALTTEIAVTSAAGTAVHAISSPVCPWIGGPSESSSGRTRNFTTAY